MSSAPPGGPGVLRDDAGMPQVRAGSRPPSAPAGERRRPRPARPAASSPLPPLPFINARSLEDDAELTATAAALGIARELFAKGPLPDHMADEDFPGPAVSGPDEVVRYALDTGTGSYHAVGASAMGLDADDVADPRLWLRGVTGLRVVDASVLPVQVAGNTAPHHGDCLDRRGPHPRRLITRCARR